MVPPVAAIEPLYAEPTVPPGSEVVVTLSVLGAVAAAIEICRFEVADCGEFLVESFTLIATVSSPASVGVPVIAPVELLIDNPPGRPLALYL